MAPILVIVGSREASSQRTEASAVPKQREVAKCGIVRPPLVVAHSGPQWDQSLPRSR